MFISGTAFLRLRTNR
ncbi:erythromycin resistance leader peptide [Actinobaculum suis]